MESTAVVKVDGLDSKATQTIDNQFLPVITERVRQEKKEQEAKEKALLAPDKEQEKM